MKFDKMSKTIVAIIAILILATIALLKDVDGALLGTSIGLIAALGGYAAGLSKRPK